MTENQSLATRPNGSTSPALMSRTLEGMDDFSTADLEIPVIKIVHGVSKMEGADEHIGWWWNSISGEFSKTLEVVVLNGRHSRALFSGNASESDRPECVSRDGVTGSEYGTCSECDYNAEVHTDLWSDKSSKRCNKGYTLFLYQPSSDDFAIFQASKTNVAPVRRLNTQLALKYKVPLFGALVTFGTERHEEAGKKWFTIAPKITRILPPAEVAEYRQMAQALRGVSLKVVDEEPVDTEPRIGEEYVSGESLGEDEGFVSAAALAEDEGYVDASGKRTMF